MGAREGRIKEAGREDRYEGGEWCTERRWKMEGRRERWRQSGLLVY